MKRSYFQTSLSFPSPLLWVRSWWTLPRTIVMASCLTPLPSSTPPGHPISHFSHSLKLFTHHSPHWTINFPKAGAAHFSRPALPQASTALKTHICQINEWRNDCQLQEGTMPRDIRLPVSIKSVCDIGMWLCVCTCIHTYELRKD